MKLDKQKILIIFLFTGIFILTNYILIEKWIEFKQDGKISFYEDGYEQGLNDAVMVLFHNTNDCNLSTITLENETRTIVDASCLNFNQNTNLP